jgi:hypothetical protein
MIVVLVSCKELGFILGALLGEIPGIAPSLAKGGMETCAAFWLS